MRLTDKGFIYTSAVNTDIGKRFRRIIREQEAAKKATASESAKVVAARQIKRAKS